ncbi:hypothetical protein DFH09DRAFT_1053808 [Mycena vulgaris]|nr:hypothetical protein DFH09DRAFT_1053808 [Mycena vulgaris]
MEDVPPSKRRRTDEESPEPELLRSDDYWFDDGNIILQVESTLFRLTKSMLSLHSSVFRDMFMMPLPTDEPTVDDCPVVILSGDTPQDWTHLLGAIYPTCLPEGPPSFALIAAVLRLSKKYDLHLFRQDCIRRLKVEFPANLTDFDDFENWELIEEDDDILFPLLSLAREIDVHSILPSIYYHIINDREEMHGVVYAKDASLNTDDRLACLQGYMKLLELQSKTTMAWLDSDNVYIPTKQCRSVGDCEDALNAIIVSVSRPGRPEIRALDNWNKDWENDFSLCRFCRQEAMEVFERGRKKCWKKLPSVFGLPDWEKLNSLDFE